MLLDMTLRRFAVAFALVCGPASDIRCQPPAPDRIALSHVTVIDGTGAPPQRDRTILIERGRIVTVQSAATRIPNGYAERNLSGRYVIPGLIDAHVHVGTQARPDGVMDAILRAAFLGGVTAARDMGGQYEIVSHSAALGRIDSVPMPRLMYSTIVAGPGM